MRITRHKNSHFWAVKEADGTLLCVCVYRKGAVNLVRRLRRLMAPADDPHPPAHRFGSRIPILIRRTL